MTTKLKWRLTKLPTSEEVTNLVNDKIISKEEARDILFSQEEEGEVAEKDLKSEIKFLRELVDKLSSSNSKIVEVIKEVQVPYYRYDWYKPYYYWVGGSGNNSLASTGSSLTTTSGNYTLAAGGTTTGSGNAGATTTLTGGVSSFKDISTF